MSSLIRLQHWWSQQNQCPKSFWPVLSVWGWGWLALVTLEIKCRYEPYLSPERTQTLIWTHHIVFSLTPVYSNTNLQAWQKFTLILTCLVALSYMTVLWKRTSAYFIFSLNALLMLHLNARRKMTFLSSACQFGPASYLASERTCALPNCS